MPSKKRKYNARFPAGRIKKIMQTDEEVGKVAQAVPIIIYATPRTLELFVESLLRKAMQVTQSRNAKTLSPSHVKQCILGEARFDFLRDLVKNIPDVSAAEEKEMMSAESSPTSSRFSDVTVQRRVIREDSNSSSSCDFKPQQIPTFKRALSEGTEAPRPRIETVTSAMVSVETAMDLSKKKDDSASAPRKANFYQETLVDLKEQASVIQANPTYTNQPSTSTYTPLEPVNRIEVPKKFVVDVKQNNNVPTASKTPVTPILNIDFSKNLCNPEIKVLDTSAAANIVGVKEKSSKIKQNLKAKIEVKKDFKLPCPPVDIDHINSGNLQIDEDYDT